MEKDPEWFFSCKDDFHKLLENEFIKISTPIEFDKLVIVELSYASECFRDIEKSQKGREIQN